MTKNVLNKDMIQQWKIIIMWIISSSDFIIFLYGFVWQTMHITTTHDNFKIKFFLSTIYFCSFYKSRKKVSICVLNNDLDYNFFQIYLYFWIFFFTFSAENIEAVFWTSRIYVTHLTYKTFSWKNFSLYIFN